MTVARVIREWSMTGPSSRGRVLKGIRIDGDDI
jgi:hypothetical protein